MSSDPSSSHFCQLPQLQYHSAWEQTYSGYAYSLKFFIPRNEGLFLIKMSLKTKSKGNESRYPADTVYWKEQKPGRKMDLNSYSVYG